MSPPPRLPRPIRLIVSVAAALLLLPGMPPTPVDAAARPGGVGATLQRWAWPVEAPHPIWRAYRAPDTRYTAGHRGIDIGATDDDESTSIIAPADGVVHFAGVVVDRPVLSLRHPGGLLTSFEPVITSLAAGDAVRRGDIIGTLAGPVTHCDRPCLHFGVRRYGDYVSPLLYLSGIPPSVLLPTRELP